VLAKGPPGNAPMGALSATRVAEEAAALLARPEPVPMGEFAA
jgi:heptosyltransferase-3